MSLAFVLGTRIKVVSLSNNRSTKKLKGSDSVSIKHIFSFGKQKMIFLVNQLQIENYRVPIWRSRVCCPNADKYSR